MTTYSQQIIWTVLPNGTDPTGQNLQFSVHVAPRLMASDPSDAALSNWSEWVDWPSTLQGITFSVVFDGALPVPVTPVSALPAGAPWSSLFSAATIVSPYRTLDLSGRGVWSYPATNIHEYTKRHYQSVVSTFPNQHPTGAALLYGFGDTYFPFLAGNPSDLALFAPTIVPAPDLGEYVDQIPAGDPTPLPPRGSITNGAPNNQLNPAPVGAPASPKVTKWTGGGAVASVRHEIHMNKVIQNTGLDTQSDFAQLYLYHQPYVTPEDNQGWTPQQPSVDFHQMLSHAGGHPSLMRLLGIVLDFEVPLPASAPTTVTLLVNPSSTDNVLPITNCTYAPGPSGGPGLFVATSKSGDSDLVNGALQLSNGHFEVLDIDTDGAGMKMLNFSSHLTWAMTVMQTDDTPTTFASPHLRSPGFSVAHFDWANQQYQQLQSQSALSGIVASGGTPSLFAEDITRGYYIHAFSPLHGQWLSLGQRTGTYNFLSTGQIISVTDEAAITVAHTTDPRSDLRDGSTPDGNSNDLTTSPHLFHWNGWSLAASHPGLWLQEDQTLGNPEPEPGEFNAVFSFEAKPGSLPLLRYGQSYQFRAWASDLAGNSLPFNQPDTNPDPSATAPVPFSRFEPIPQPPVLLVAPPTPGESAERMVIRSNYDTACNTTDARHLVPPKMSQYMAELSGAFDKPTGISQDAYNQIVQLADGSLANADSATPLPGQPGSFYYPTNNLQVPYLPDYHAAGAALLDLPGTVPGTVTTAPFLAPDQSWPHLVPIQLILAEGSAAPVYAPDGGAEGTLTVYIPKGQTAAVQLSCYINQSNLPSMGHWQWVLDNAGLASSDVQALEALALQGQMWAVTPFRELLLVHAVRQPLATPEFSTSFVANKYFPAQTYADLQDTMTWDRSSTSKVHITGTWLEYIDAGPGGPPPSQTPTPGSTVTPNTGDIAFDVAIWRGDQTFLTTVLHAGRSYQSIKVHDLPQALPDGVPLIISWNGNVQEVVVDNPGGYPAAPSGGPTGPVTIAVQPFTANSTYPLFGGSLPSPPYPAGSKVPKPGTQVTFDGWNATTLPLEQHHEFHDTKHRNVTYQAEATTAFAEYFYETTTAELTGSGPTQIEPDGFVPGTVTVSGTPGAPPRNQNLSAISFVDASHGWAAGNDGTILVTRNGGSTWYGLTPGTNANFTGISFVNVKLGWALAQNGTLLTTSDGGLTWQTLPAVQNNLRGLSFADANFGWAVGQNGVILSTNSGGATWSSQASGTTKNLNGVSFVSDTIGYVVGQDGLILTTADGGGTWVALTAPTNQDLNGVSFVDADTGWVVGQDGVIFATTDGGQTWTAQSASTNQNLTDVSFVSVGTPPTKKYEGWLTAQNGQIFSTINGGRAWAQQQLVYPPVTAQVTSTMISAGNSLTAGQTVSSLPVTATTEVILAGDTVTIGGGTIAPTATVTATAPVGATTLSITAITPAANIPSNTPVSVTGGDWIETDSTGNLSLSSNSAIPIGTTVQVTYLAQPITRKGAPVTLNIFSSARPAAPNLAYVVPTFGWTETNTLFENIHSTKTGGTLRVYMERPWWSSGEGELLGVVTWHATGGQATPNSTIAPYVTQVGNDPVHVSPQIPYTLSVSDFPLAVAKQLNTTVVELGTQNQAAGMVVDVAGHVVEYDAARDLWFSDIQISQGSAYWPYVRLALCRFQPSSIGRSNGREHPEPLSDDYFISPIRLAEFIQTAPDRTTTVTQTADSPVSVNVTMTGQSYAAVDSGVYPTAPNYTTVTANGPSLVFASLEEEILQWDSDLAWQPVKDGVGNPVIMEMSASALGNGQTSWSTSLVLPTDGGTFRLVIEEYELYATDDLNVSQAAAGTPGGPGMRIVHTDVIYLGPQRLSQPMEVVGQHGAIAGSTNFGNTWKTATSGTTNDLYGIDVVTGSAAFAVGVNGTLLATTDGGQTWIAQKSGTNRNLYGVSFVDANHGWVVGQNGTILNTGNGGVTWAAQTSPSTQDLTGVSFIDSTHGWISAKNGVVLATTDGGAPGTGTWTAQSTGTNQQLNGISFVNDSIGWAVGNSGTIITTQNGGSSWTAQPSPTRQNLYGVSMIDAQHGWAVGQNGVVISTSNGGSKWTLQQPWSAGNLQGVCFFNAAIGLAVGQNGLIIMTTTGGAAWAQPIPNNVNGTGVSFITPMQGWAAGNNGVIAMTTNGGNDWSLLPSGTKQNLTGISFATPTAGWAVGQNGLVLATGNGGQSWSTQSSGTNQNLSAVSFIDTTDGWALGSNGLLLSTTNGGANWSRLATSGLPNNMFGLAFTNATRAWAVGANGSIATTGNGGSTWTAQVSPTNQNLNAVAFNGANGWAVGQNGTIINTTNGGASWTTQVSPTTQNLNGVSFSDANNGFAFGQNGTVLATSNGGTKWVLIPTAPTNQNLLGVS
jgi:photosystem II stability/assembly factor-like uncharacterized protein